MQVARFADTYTSRNEEGKMQLFYRQGYSPSTDTLYAIRMTPHVTVSRVNPNGKHYWQFCQDYVLWYVPHNKLSSDIPSDKRISDGSDEFKQYWIDAFNKAFPNGKGLEPYVAKFYRYNQNKLEQKGNDSDISSDEEDDNENNETEVSDTNDTDASECDSDSGDDATNMPTATLADDMFYQNDSDKIRANIAFDEISEDKNNNNLTPEQMANPQGEDFQERFLKGRTVTPEQISAGLAQIRNMDGQYEKNFDFSTLNSKQKMALDIIQKYAHDRYQWKINGGKKPKALRMMLSGMPGAGKSWALRASVTSLINMIGDSWEDYIKLGAPTGCASFHMSFGAMTLHRLCGIQVAAKDFSALPAASQAFKELCQRLKTSLFLIVIDEFSMVGRRLFNIVMSRLAEAGIDASNIGIVFVGDPAQILPIGDAPIWSIRHKSERGGKELSKLSRDGITTFRQQFRMPPLEEVPGHDSYMKSLQKSVCLTPKEQKMVDIFLSQVNKGDYEVIFLDEVMRKVSGDEISHKFVSEILPNMRYGKIRQQDMEFLKIHHASPADIKANSKWSDRVLINGYHYFQEEHSDRPTVDSDNMHALFQYHKISNQPIIGWNSIHLPATAKQTSGSAKVFGGVPAQVFTCPGNSIMLLQNIAPSLNLFNGSRHKFVGPLYFDRPHKVTLTVNTLKTILDVNTLHTVKAIDTASNTLHQLPTKSVLKSINAVEVEKKDIKLKLRSLLDDDKAVCVFSIPSKPPALPDYIVLEVANYAKLGGPNIFRFPESKNWVPIAPVERRSEESGTNKKNKVSRFGFPVEGGTSFTAYKGQGDTLDLVELKVKEQAGVCGLFMVGESRVRSPKHIHIPPNEWPSCEEINMQRLNSDVIEAENFERRLRITSAVTVRKWSKDWTKEDNDIADSIHDIWEFGNISQNDICSSLVKNNSNKVSQIDVQLIYNKMLLTDEKLLTEPIHKLTETEKRNLKFHREVFSSKKTTTKKKKTKSLSKNNVKHPSYIPVLCNRQHIILTKNMIVLRDY